MRQSTALHVTRRNQVSAVVRQAKHYCVDRDADFHDVVADPPRLPGWERVVGDGRHLPEERPAVLDQPVSNPLAFSGSPHATLRFPKLPRRGCETTAGSTEGWSNHLAFRIAGELWRRRDERQKSESSAAGDCLKGTLTTSGPPGYCRIGANSRPRSVEGRYAVPPVPAREPVRSSFLQLMWCGFRA